MKMDKQSKNKLKTLPNQLSTNHQEFLFQSQTQQNVKIRKINLASPTFATTVIGSDNKNILSSSRVVNKENKIGLELKELELHQNNLKTVNQPRIVFQSTKKSDYDFLKGQNEKLVQKCKILDQMKRKIEQDNKILITKLNICKGCLQQKKFKNMQKFLHMQNSSNSLTNIDLYLQMQAFKQDYKQCKDKNLELQNENSILNIKLIELQQIIQNYTQKSEKKRVDLSQKQTEDKKKEKNSQNQLQQLQKKYQEKYREIINQYKQKEKLIKKLKDQYEKLKFLKEEIQKKRQEDIKNRQFIQDLMEKKEEDIQNLRLQLLKCQQENQRQNNKVKQLSETSLVLSGFQISLSKQLQQQKILTIKLQKQLEESKNNLRKFQDELQQTRKEKGILLDDIKQLNVQKNKLEMAVANYILKEQLQQKRISELQSKFSYTQNQLQDFKLQLEKCLQKKNHFPQISRFKQQNSQQMTEDKDRESGKRKEGKYNKIIKQLNLQIQQLKKQKQNLQGELETEREKYQRIYDQLQNTYRKFQQFESNDLQKQELKIIKQLKQKDRYNKKLDGFGSTLLMHYDFSRSTKAAPQLKMIRQILAAMLIKDGKQKKRMTIKPLIRQKQKQPTFVVQILIDDIKRMAQQAADMFDDRKKQIQILVNKVQNKQEVISKLLRFTPQKKKGCILQYLKIMQNINQYQIQQVYKITKILQQQASDWKQQYNKLLQIIDENEQEIQSLKKQLSKIKSEETRKKYQNNFIQKMESRKQKKIN